MKAAIGASYFAASRTQRWVSHPMAAPKISAVPAPKAIDPPKRSSMPGGSARQRTVEILHPRQRDDCCSARRDGKGRRMAERGAHGGQHRRLRSAPAIEQVADNAQRRGEQHESGQGEQHGARMMRDAVIGVVQQEIVAGDVGRQVGRRRGQRSRDRD